ncbi:type II toxin-antitoxin system VapC family toxin [Brevundimonas sp.]|uniref:type II toxin-antitoxin system VapC family toxin n=1 Tax=Brevundimonas sp. TaxID=1871086 RepID=UPI00272F84CA|nr:type II toxin-antitoxin system VapC family toxin [Brevundimonas sp.]MDP1913686.1 type II toxin-antitoxin system VapC family toxin [Brevundimonas sp.]
MTGRPILLDTCAAIWLQAGAAFRPEGEAALQEAQKIGTQVLVSPITAWEIGLLVSKGRLVLSLPPLTWFEQVLELGVDLAPLTPDILIASSQLPGPPLRDPADRIVAATARAMRYRLITRDRPLLDFAASGQVAAIAC